MTIFLVACSNNTINDYPRYTQQVLKMENQKTKHPVKSISNDVPVFNNVQNYMAPGHLFTMSHSSDALLSGRFRADFNGMLHLPYKVNVNVTNKTFDEVKEIVLNEYRSFFQKGVEGVNFNLASRNYWVEVRGLVKKPGRYLIRPTDTLDLVVDTAGGIQGDISTNYYSATMKQSSYEYKVLLNRYFESNDSVDKIKWLGGDNVFITKLDSLSGNNKDIPFVTIIGGVMKAGKVLYQKDASLFYYIEKSGGLIQGLGYDECYIFRNNKDGANRINFSFNRPETIPVLFPNDTVYMNSKVQADGDTWLQRFGQIAGIISTGALLIIAL